MKLSQFFISRPIFASVIWIIVVIIGLLSYSKLPVEQYPQVVPPTVVVAASYPGASADVVAKTVATPLEQQINGVENMLYMSSQSSNDGSVSITVTFKIGTNLDTAQVLVQNRVAVALPRLPEEAQRRGVTTLKNSPDLMMVVNLFSPDGSYDQSFIANYANLQLKDQLARIEGVGDIKLFGSAEYAMRIWLDPQRIAEMGITGDEVISALQAQNVQVASGTLGQQPTPKQTAFELNVQTQGRLTSPEEFANIVIKNGADGRLVRVRDVGRVELGSDTYTTKGYLGDKKAIALPIFQLPGSNALSTAEEIEKKMDELSKTFPKGIEYKIIYNPTEFIAQSIDAVKHTIFEAIFLVVIVILVFLQSWRAAIIPVVAIPISLIGTFAVMAGLGFSLNNLTLFGLVLAIGIVVDDAIVVVENMERLMANGLTPKEAARKCMDEVGNALVAIGLVLIAVFMPTKFIPGISGKFFQEFGMVIAIATAFSVGVSLTLSPALAALLLKPGDHQAHGKKPRVMPNPWRWFCFHFNRGMEGFSHRYSTFVGKIVHRGWLMIIIYVGLMMCTVVGFRSVPTGFIPPQDQGYFIIAIQLPPGSSLSRTEEVVQEVTKRVLAVDGIWNTVGFAGFNAATFTSASNGAAIFPRFVSFEERQKKGITTADLLTKVRAAVKDIDKAMIIVIPPPPVRGIGNGGGFKMMLEDRGGLGIDQLNGALWQLAGAANQSGIANNTFSFFENSTPQLYLNVDHERAEELGVSMDAVYSALNIYLGSAYVNDFNYLGRTYRVTAQADSAFRMEADSVKLLKVRNKDGNMVPLGAFITFENRAGTSRQPRYNLYNAVEVQGDTAPGHSSGEAIALMEDLAAKMLPNGISYEWTELAYQQKASQGAGNIAFILAVVFVFLLLSALYESWVLPMAIILIVPMCLFSAISGIWMLGRDVNVLTQIGFIVLIGLACKNAILIVEFAKEREEQGETPWQAAVDAAKLRLRPILMTSFAFILGAVPLVIATGAGAEMRQALGITVFAGMIGVTFFGLIFTPVFYVLCRLLVTRIHTYAVRLRRKPVVKIHD